MTPSPKPIGVALANYAIALAEEKSPAFKAALLQQVGQLVDSVEAAAIATVPSGNLGAEVMRGQLVKEIQGFATSIVRLAPGWYDQAAYALLKYAQEQANAWAARP